ncbi:MAG: DUF885 domain-containing protein [Pyrinomonadaceae bacterium MAG19_C2-C3]|nr:DUF885 domain-containing protein [Pyrinomonadaceae bacterium MAG19_C2-C3]
MMRKLFLTTLVALVACCAALTLTSTAQNKTKMNLSAEDAKFERLARAYIEELLKQNPERATELGDHRFDARLDDRSRAGIEADRKFATRYLAELARLKPSNLSQTNRIDYQILKSRLEYQIFSLDTLRDYETNPLMYNPGGAIYALIARDFAPLPERLTNLKGRLEGVPSVVAAAKANLKNPPRVFTETAITQNKGTINLIREELNKYASDVPQNERAGFQTARTNAVAALEDYGKWLEKDLLPRSNGDFRIGAAKFDAKLKFALSSPLTKEEILRRAMADLKSTQDEMYQTALPLHRKFYPNEQADMSRMIVIKRVLDKLAETRPNNDTIVPKAEETLKATTDFVRANNIVTVPDDPVKIIVMPEYSRGSAVAYCDAAGVLEKNGTTFYAISPTPSDWKPERVESFFKEYNDYMLEDLTIHEAMPGHYLQIAHANRFSAPTIVRSLFYSGTFVEGWAVYAERVMADAGYGGAEVKMQQLKMKLRVIINAIIDQKIHTAGMTEKEAVAFMMNEGFQEEGEAAGKWRRANLSSTQLSTYYVGSLEVADIRRDYERKMGKQFDMKKAHDLMLSFGSPAPKYVRESMGL